MMGRPSQPQSWAVVLLDADNNVVAHLTTDHSNFVPVVALGRDRVFLLAGQDNDGAIYAEVPVWRVGSAAVGRFLPTRRTTPAMLHFQGGNA